MFLVALCCSTLLISAFANKCGNPPVCWCVPVHGITLCKNVNALPVFNGEEKNRTLFLDLIDTNITELPDFRPWVNLEMIYLRNSRYLCNICIEKAEHVYLDTDCLSLSEHIHEGEHHQSIGQIDWPYLFLLIPLFFIGIFLGYELKMHIEGNTIRLYRKKDENTRSENVSVTYKDEKI